MYLFLAPHYDDAVYSCGGTIHQLTTTGTPVHVLTVMGGDPPDPPPDTPITRDLHRRWQAGPAPIVVRREEDETALALMGATGTHLSIPDCVYRTAPDDTPLYPSEESLWDRVHPADPATTQLATTELPAGATGIYAPLGVGGHVDHLVVRDYGLRLATTLDVEVWLYVDFPYSEDPVAIETALKNIPVDATLRPHAIQLTEADITAKIEGVKAYRSQISTFWEDETALAERVRAGLVGQSPTPTEHYYQIQKGEEGYV